jgi:hypothetical protein
MSYFYLVTEMSLSWSEIKQKWIKDFEIGYPRRSIELAFNTIITQWGVDFIKIGKSRTIWDIIRYIDLGLLIHELNRMEDITDLITRLGQGEEAAYSEARLVTYFSKMGYEVQLQQVIAETGRKNDLAVKINSNWLNIEVKTPQRSDLEKELTQDITELCQLICKIPLSRDIHLCLTRIPTEEERKAIADFTKELALRVKQPAYGRVNEKAFVRTDFSSIKKTPWSESRREEWTLQFLEPKQVQPYYEGMPILERVMIHLGDEKNKQDILLYVKYPFEDHRLVDLIEKKRKQLSPTSCNIVAFETTHVPIWPSEQGQYKWITRLHNAMKNKLSQRIGAVLLFSRMTYEGELRLTSSLFVHPKPYRQIPSEFLENCDLNDYHKLRKTWIPF